MVILGPYPPRTCPFPCDRGPENVCDDTGWITSDTHLLPAKIHDLVDVRGGQAGLVQPKASADVFHDL